MKIKLISFLMGLILSFNVFAQQAKPFKLQNRQGDWVQLSDFKDKVILLDFWASWCIPCRESFPWMNTLQDKYQAKGFEVVTINLDQEAEEKARFLKKYNANFTVLSDPNGDTPKAYNVLGMPTSMIIDRQGNIVYKHIGYKASDASFYEQKIVDAINAGS